MIFIGNYLYVKFKIIRKVLMVSLILFAGLKVNGQRPGDWNEIKNILSDCKGIYSGPNNNIATSGLPDGPLLGNGNVGAVGSCDQNWARFYLTTTDFWTGDPIPEAKTDEEWIRAATDKQPAWCYYNNDPTIGVFHGKLYNAFAMIDPRGITPEGYRTATDADWVRLASLMGGRDTAGFEMKNKKSFGAFMGGYRNYEGKFYGLGVNGYWWSTTVIFGDVMWNVVLNHKNNVVFRNYSNQMDGLYIRCLKK